MVTHSATDTLPIAPGESRVAMRGMDWVAYCQMRSLLNERTRARLTYDRGTLEITTSSKPTTSLPAYLSRLMASIGLL